MPKSMPRAERILLGRKRLVSVLSQHKVALWRTLENKIADAGPFGQRINPHLLTLARKELESAGRIERIHLGGVDWYHLSGARPADVRTRLDLQLPIHVKTCENAFTLRVGQALEIAVYRAIAGAPTLEGMGRFFDLDAHDDSTLYSKEEPPSAIAGREIKGKRKLDFLVRHPMARHAGIEVKNVREWIYPHDRLLKELITKCVELDAVPILIARRLPFVTFKVCFHTGILVHETFNQLYPEADRRLAEKAWDKRLLGFHDIRCGNDPDNRLLKFVQRDLLKLLPDAREKFDKNKDIAGLFAAGKMTLDDFLRETRLRSQQDIPDFDEDF